MFHSAPRLRLPAFELGLAAARGGVEAPGKRSMARSRRCCMPVYSEKNANAEEIIRIIPAREADRLSAEFIWNKPLSKRQKATPDRIAKA